MTNTVDSSGMILCCSDLRDSGAHHYSGRHVDGCPLAKRNGSVTYRGYAVVRGGLGEYLLCDAQLNCFHVSRSVADAKNTLDEHADGSLY